MSSATLTAEPLPLQRAPLRVSQPDDPLEKEAEEVADRVMRMPSPEVGLIQRCPGGCPDEEMVYRQPADDEEGEELIQRCPGGCPDEEVIRRQVNDEAGEGILARRISRSWKGPAAPPEVASAIQARRGSGSPLPLSTRRVFETRFGADFSKVRVHHDSEAADLASRVNARAFTMGQDLFFGSGQWSPGSFSGNRLIAHELTHVVQQRHELTHVVQQRAVLGPSVRLGRLCVGEVIQRDLAIEPPEEVPAQPDLTADQITRAIRYNSASYDPDSTRLIQDLVGAEQTGTFDESTVLLVADIQERFGLGKDGRVGPNTYDLLIRVLQAEGTAPGTCLTSFQLVGPEPLRFFRNSPTTGTIGSRFFIRIRLDPRCNCGDWQYRQEIAGNVELHDVRGGVFPANARFNIPGGGLPPTLQEDGDTTIPAGVAGHRYGHRLARDNPTDDRDRYLPDRRTGCQYEGRDLPELFPLPAAAGDAGDRYDWNMRFRGRIYREGHGVVAEKYWAIRENVVIPPP